MYLKDLIIYNRAPFEDLRLTFDKTGVNVLSGINGKGKTTILSYITDAFYEMAKNGFYNEFEGKQNKYYRISSSLYNIDKSKTSFVYLRFSDGKGLLDYIDVRSRCSKEEYDELVDIDGKIPYEKIEASLTKNNYIKYWSETDQKNIEKIFQSNIITYFPAYRYEQIPYLNNDYKVNLKFTKEMSFAGYLPNKIEVVSDFPQIANWIMDIVLDFRSGDVDDKTQNIYSKVIDILSNILIGKAKSKVRLGIGPRNFEAIRVQVIKNDENVLYPSIFEMSSGEMALTTMFCELLKQTDRLNVDIKEIEGIVLIDEIDKHLHIKLQKDVLPKLIKMFPKLQFIVSTHSPFFNMGLEEHKINNKIFDLDNNGICCSPLNNDLFSEVYDMFIQENEQFYELYQKLEKKLKNSQKPLIITEGKTDIIHIKNAIEKLGIHDVDVEFFDVPNDFGNQKLLTLLENATALKPRRKVIGIFDRDDPKITGQIGFQAMNHKCLGNDVYALLLPLVNSEIYGDKISIEHYYKKENLLKENKEWRRLFLGEEFYLSQNSIDGKFETQISNLQNKIKVNGIIDEKVYKRGDLEHTHSIAMSKMDFANLVSNDSNFVKDFDFSNFKILIDEIKNICELQ